jgi:Phage Terminase
MRSCLAEDIAGLLDRWRANRMEFRKHAIILEDGRPFGEAMDDWQEADFRALDSGRYRHAYWERPRGHGKTFDVGTEALAELVLGQPGGRLYAAAADADQGRLLTDDVIGKVRRSPLLSSLVKITKDEITATHTGTTLVVLPADIPGRWGLRPDWVACDEITEWRRREFWDALWSATGKRPRCRMHCIATAGWDKASLAWEVRGIAESEEDWHFSSRGQCASWISPAWLAQQKRTLPEHVYRRLHENEWVEGVGAFLTEQEVEAVFTLEAEALVA